MGKKLTKERSIPRNSNILDALFRKTGAMGKGKQDNEEIEHPIHYQKAGELYCSAKNPENFSSYFDLVTCVDCLKREENDH